MTLPADLVQYLTRPDAIPGSRRAQGVIISWDTETFENVIAFRGTEIENMPLLTDTAGSLNYRGGDVVILEGWGPEGRLSSWYIIGRVIVPPFEEVETD